MQIVITLHRHHSISFFCVFVIFPVCEHSRHRTSCVAPPVTKAAINKPRITTIATASVIFCPFDMILFLSFIHTTSIVCYFGCFQYITIFDKSQSVFLKKINNFNKKINFAFERSYIRRNICNTGRTDFPPRGSEPSRPRPDSLYKRSTPSPRRNRKIRNPRNWKFYFASFFTP